MGSTDNHPLAFELMCEFAARTPHRTGCTGKQRFATQAEAWRVIASVKRRTNAKVVRAYQCRHCGGWHNTSKPLELTHDHH